MSGKANSRASTMAGRKLTTTEMKVAGIGLMPCIPTRAKMAVLAKPSPASRERPTASMKGVTGLPNHCYGNR